MGFSALYTPEYLQQTPTGLFIFRLKVPLDCLPFLSIKELRYSLKTHCIYSARKHIAAILPFLRGVFEGIRQGRFTSTKQLDLNQIIKKGMRHAIATGNRVLFTQSTTAWASSNDIPVDQPPIALPVDISPNPPATKKSDTTTRRPTPIEPAFSDLQESFFKEKELSQGWRLKTQEDHAAVFALFVEVFGNVPVGHIDKILMRDFKSIIIQLPPNMRKMGKYKNKTIPEIVAMKPLETLSTHTVNKYLSRLSNLFAYAITHGYMTANPATGLKVKLKSRPDEEREAYTIDDLKKLFNSNEYREDKYKTSYAYWAPLIALYSGCRLEEICQLHLADIRQEEGGVWVFDINDKLEKNLKTLSSSRMIPVHPHLISRGLLKHVDTLRTKGENRLFPELHQRRDGYGQEVSRWFHVYKEKCGIDKGKTFHSFRHTFITHLKHKQVDPFMIHELDGHAITNGLQRLVNYLLLYSCHNYYSLLCCCIAKHLLLSLD
jgi:integrase